MLVLRGDIDHGVPIGHAAAGGIAHSDPPGVGKDQRPSQWTASGYFSQASGQRPAGSCLNVRTMSVISFQTRTRSNCLAFGTLRGLVEMSVAVSSMQRPRYQA